MYKVYFLKPRQLRYCDDPLPSILDVNMSGLSILWFLWFYICLLPIDIGDFGINYLFLLTPIFHIFSGRRLRFPPPIVRILGTLALLIFIMAIFYQFKLYDEAIRRIISLFLFISIFSLSFINLKYKEINSFVLAVIAVSCTFSAISIYKLFFLGLLENSFDAKEEVGSQRYGFLLVFSFWAIFSYLRGRNLVAKSCIITLAILLFCGVILTFSRASLVALVGSSVLYILLHNDKVNFTRIFYRILIIGLAIVLLSNISVFFPSIFQFFDERLIELFTSGRIFDQIFDAETSEGTRLRIWANIFEYVILNPLTGSGFLGSWILSKQTGSSHSQYMDVFLRLGFFGFFAYVALLWQICKFLKKNNDFLLCGFGGILIYGLFHETFKESNGSFLLAFLLAYYSTSLRRAALDKKRLQVSV